MATRLAELRPQPAGLLDDTAAAVRRRRASARRRPWRPRSGGRRAASSTRPLLDREQKAAHGLAWVEVYVRSLRQMQAWAKRLAMPAGWASARR